ASWLRRARQGAALDEGRRPGDRRGPRSQAEDRSGSRRGRVRSAVTRSKKGGFGRPFCLRYFTLIFNNLREAAKRRIVIPVTARSRRRAQIPRELTSKHYHAVRPPGERRNFHRPSAALGGATGRDRYRARRRTSHRLARCERLSRPHVRLSREIHRTSRPTLGTARSP